MNPDDFQKLYLAEMEEMRSVEAQMADSLGELAERATNATLAQTIRDHQDKTREHRDRLDDLLKAHGGKPDGHSDTSMKTLISEADKWAGMVEDETLRDAGLIASLQRMEHYEIAVLGTLASWAKSLGHGDDAAVLSRILDDDKDTDARLSQIAEETVNPAAA